MKTGQRVFIKELNAFGNVTEVTAGIPTKVEVQTPTGPQVVDVLEKTFTLLTSLRAILEIIIAIIKGWGR